MTKLGWTAACNSRLMWLDKLVSAHSIAFSTAEKTSADNCDWTLLATLYSRSKESHTILCIRMLIGREGGAIILAPTLSQWTCLGSCGIGEWLHISKLLVGSQGRGGGGGKWGCGIK